MCLDVQRVCEEGDGRDGERKVWTLVSRDREGKFEPLALDRDGEEKVWTLAIIIGIYFFSRNGKEEFLAYLKIFWLILTIKYLSCLGESHKRVCGYS